ncbi:hypothetical protein ABGB07_11510 [Micromonosporaceae bacterium B7E4]
MAGRSAWRHTPSGVVFRKVPGGTFRMGLSDAELDAVRAIERAGEVEDTIEPFLATAGDAQPVREVRVEPFLIARHPLTVAQVRHWLPDYEDQPLDDFADEERTAASENAFGLAAMGSAGELCADVWFPGHAGAPTDARPRTGNGRRTVRGDAADLSLAGLRRVAALRHPVRARPVHRGTPGRAPVTRLSRDRAATISALSSFCEALWGR